MDMETKCPVNGGKVDGAAVLFDITNRLWWPNQLDLSVLHQNPPASDPDAARRIALVWRRESARAPEYRLFAQSIVGALPDAAT